eukprot:NODE_29713_length_438_cov_1.430868.p1 GENE.NODE_29713_length_438_cov_1.430868~~NODE_29713_length_438_cov_1.430868.p1  ORF type:complete len:105 (+),score=41.92 NODE_29713_length_438_cov_1.430868:84-398(+)
MAPAAATLLAFALAFRTAESMMTHSVPKALTDFSEINVLPGGLSFSKSEGMGSMKASSSARVDSVGWSCVLSMMTTICFVVVFTQVVSSHEKKKKKKKKKKTTP